MRGVISAALLLAGTATAAAETPGIENLLAYQGTWRTDFHDVVTSYSKSGESHDVIINDCRLIATFVACAQTVNGKTLDLMVYVAGAKPGDFVSNGVIQDGSKTFGGALHMEGNVWTFPWAEQSRGKTVLFRVENRFVSAREIAFRKSYSEDGKTWVTMSSGTELRDP